MHTLRRDYGYGITDSCDFASSCVGRRFDAGVSTDAQDLASLRSMYVVFCDYGHSPVSPQEDDTEDEVMAPMQYELNDIVRILENQWLSPDLAFVEPRRSTVTIDGQQSEILGTHHVISSGLMIILCRLIC